ncbi:hypothetical protein VMCG_05911 [Cytospora schulzeri]|uniref:Uncharacterized protein n=1 Tax=Cytospora schulzeri TaxID=448051 RepID=A0A423WCU2_9PEZI|nr:hypothetical protein VMCG_05911 [Valsa malicola]
MDSPTSAWNYYYDTNVSQPLNSVVNDKEEPEIKLDASNIRPRSGDFEQVNAALARTTNENKLIYIYTLRHGRAAHNEQSNRFSKSIAWRFFAGIRTNFDPRLTKDGIDEAKMAGQILKGLVDAEGAPRPMKVYTSPLSRCVQTAMHTIKELQLGPGVSLSVREGLREWKGYGQYHQSDRRGSVSDLLALVDGLNGSLGMEIRPEIDPGLLQQSQQEAMEDELKGLGSETFTDVDIRLRRILDEIFEVEQPGSCVMLVLHNRCNKSLLRLMGHSQDEVHNFDIENCAILSYLVKRTRLTDDEVRAREWNDRVGGCQQIYDQTIALGDKEQQHQLAAEEVKRLSAGEFQRLESYLISEKERGDVWAVSAVEDLYNCREGT